MPTRCMRVGANLVSVAHGANVGEIQLVSELLRTLALEGESGEDERGRRKERNMEDERRRGKNMVKLRKNFQRGNLSEFATTSTSVTQSRTCLRPLQKNPSNFPPSACTSSPSPAASVREEKRREAGK